MRRIVVDPTIMESCASRIENENSDYQKTFTQLFEQVDAMKSGWEGKDNLAFTNQIRGFEPDFRQIQTLCTQYAEFLRSSARAYRETQDELAANAARLTR